MVYFKLELSILEEITETLAKVIKQTNVIIIFHQWYNID